MLLEMLTFARSAYLREPDQATTINIELVYALFLAPN